MKKFLTVLLVLCLVATGLSAANFRVGAELGWGFDFYKYKGTFSVIGTNAGEFTMKLKNNGFSANLIGEYDFTKNIGIKASAGMMFAGKAKTELESEDMPGMEPSSDAVTERSGLWLDFALDGKFTFPVNDKFSLAGLAGLELMYGALYKEEGMSDEMLKKYKNLAFGANIGVEVSYMVIENLRINAGVTGAWFFVNKCDIMNEIDKEAEAMTALGTYGLATYKSSKTSFYIRPYVGATYAF